MSGYKKTIQEFAPAGFWSFDGEPVDPQSRLFTHTPLLIFDESGKGNDGMLLLGTEAPNSAYRAGMGSLVALEPSQQSSVSFGHYGKVGASWPKALVQIPHSPSFDTAANFGSFTWQLLLNKATDEANFRNLEPTQGSITLPRTILHKPAQLTFNIVDYWASEDYIQITMPNGLASIPVSAVPGFYGSVNHFVMVWDVKRSQQGFQGTATVYINGISMWSSTTQYADAFLPTSVNLPAEIGGQSTGGFTSDRATSPTYIDAVAYWPRALKPIEIYRLFKKIWQYTDMVKKKAPVLFATFQEDASPNTQAIQMEIGAGLYAQTSGAVVKERPGPPNIPGSRSFLFNNAMAEIRGVLTGSPTPITLSPSNYAIEYWVAPTSGERAVLFSMQGRERPYVGPLVELNCNAAGAWSNGQICFSEADGVAVATPPGTFYNNGAWHHIIVQRRGGEFMEIIIDGKLAVSERRPLQSFGVWPSDINLMGTSPGRLHTFGNLAYLAIYTGKTFTEFEAASRYEYAVIYRVRGNTTLRGVPYRARVRLYNYVTGHLIDETDSAAADGLFTFYLKDNSLVNAFVAAMNDQNVRVRAFGPLVPAEIPDPPV